MKLHIVVNFLRTLLFWRQDKYVERIAEELANRCRATIGWRVYCRAGDMSVSEIRGYVRALAWEYAAEELARTTNIRPALHERILLATVEKLARLIPYDTVNKLGFVEKSTMAA